MLVFQYGSNMSSARLNHSDRLNGDAKVISVASTVELFDINFTVWSNSNKCAAADMIQSQSGRVIYGVLYEIPDYLIHRDTANKQSRKSLDAIEGEGKNYKRTEILVKLPDMKKRKATTYIVKNRSSSIKTSKEYAQHIIDGLHEHEFPDEYRRYVVSKIEANNPELKDVFKA